MARVAGSFDFDRDAARRRLAEESFDVVVIGGGVTGAGVALDAAARGLRTALVEAHDLGSGSSSASSKLVHGGLRYLSSGDYRLVYEALAERQRLLRNAPHLVRQLPLLIPIFATGAKAARRAANAYSRALWLYDLSGGWRIGHRHRRVDAATARAGVPMLRTDRLASAFVYWDAQTDDARLTLALARTAALGHGATIATRCPVVAFLRRASSGAVAGVRLDDGTEVHAEVVVNATGVWSAGVAALPGGSVPAVKLRPAKGVHVTVPTARLPCDWGVVLPVPSDGRSIFIIPWDPNATGSGGPGSDPTTGRFTYIGTTDTAHDGPLDGSGATSDDIRYLLDAVNDSTTADLTPADVTGSWCGLRPLVADETREHSADLSRRHRVTTSPDGMVSIIGGKLTTYRLMAAETTDAVVALLGRRFLGYSPTRRLAIWGADGSAELLEAGAAARLGLDELTLAHLMGRYGAEARTIAAMIAGRPDLGALLVPGLPYLRAEAIFAVRYEMALSLLDVVARRTRALLLDRDATAAAAPEVASLLGVELDWSPSRQAEEVAQVMAAVATQAEALGPATADAGARGVGLGAPTTIEAR